MPFLEIASLLAGVGLGAAGAVKSAKFKRVQRKAAKHEYALKERALARQAETFKERSEINKQALAQGMAGRGLGRSTIAEQAMAQFERERKRTLEDFAGQHEMLGLEQSLFKKGVQFERQMAYIGAGMGATEAGMEYGKMLSKKPELTV